METINTMRTKEINNPKSIILDVSALTTEEGYSVVMNAEKVYLTPGTINEMVSCKAAGKTYSTEFAWRVREILRESAKDSEAQKYVCVYLDPSENIYERDIFALGKREDIDAVILTSNYGICNHAKAHNIPYRLITVAEPMVAIDKQGNTQEILEEEEVQLQEYDISLEEGRAVVSKSGYYIPVRNSDYMITDYRGKEQKRVTGKLNQADFVTEMIDGVIYCYRIDQEGYNYTSRLLVANADKNDFIFAETIPKKLAEAIQARF